MKKYIISLILVLCCHLSMKSQATIGSDLPASSGAILDLKQKNEEVSSTKGLGLPRVWLYHKKMIGLNVPNNDAENQKHIGLLVYNINHCMATSGSYETDHMGIQVWNGAEWEQISKDESLGEGVTKHVDQDGNDFLAGDFGDAGVWMLENLRAKKYASADGKSRVGFTLPTEPKISVDTNPKFVQWGYPAPKDALNPLPGNSTGAKDGTDPFFFEEENKIGLLYTWYAATGGENGHAAGGDQQQNTGIDDLPGPNEVETTMNGVHVRGICPEGWHLPTDREWNNRYNRLDRPINCKIATFVAWS